MKGFLSTLQETVSEREGDSYIAAVVSGVIRQLEPRERHWSTHPLLSSHRRVRVHVDTLRRDLTTSRHAGDRPPTAVKPVSKFIDRNNVER